MSLQRQVHFTLPQYNLTLATTRLARTPCASFGSRQRGTKHPSSEIEMSVSYDSSGRFFRVCRARYQLAVPAGCIKTRLTTFLKPTDTFEYI